MANFTNPTGNVEGTEGADTFAFTRTAGPDDVTVDGNGGYDTVTVRAHYLYSCQVAVSGSSADSLYGRIDDGPYGRHITAFAVESVAVLGSDRNDTFEFAPGDALTSVHVDFAAGAGTDALTLDLSRSTTALHLDAGQTVIRSAYGSFSGFERYSVTGGAADDVIATGDGADVIVGGGGANVLSGGGGDDAIYSSSTADRADGGAGAHDFWSGAFVDATTDLSLSIGKDVAVDGVVVASNFEYTSVSGGAGDDTVTVTAPLGGEAYGGAGSDRLAVQAAARSGERVEVVTTLDHQLLGSVVWGAGSSRALGFEDFEALSVVGTRAGDTFHLVGDFGREQVGLDGGGGQDTLEAELRAQTGPVQLTVAPTGAITSNFGHFSGIEAFAIDTGDHTARIKAGAGDDRIASGVGDDRVIGGAGDDWISAGQGHDRLNGGLGIDTLAKDFSSETAGVILDLGRTGEQATGGGSTISGFEAFGQITGTAYDDVFVEGIAAVGGGASLSTGTGGDQVTLSRLAGYVSMGAGDDLLTLDLGGLGADVSVSLLEEYATPDGGSGEVYGRDVGGSITFSGVDRYDLRFGAGNDTAFSGAGDDRLVGGAGDDVLAAGAGTDQVTGGAGADRFVYGQLDDFASGTLDEITDFVGADGDRIDLTAIADFTFIGGRAFDGRGEAQLRAVGHGGAYVLAGDVDGDGAADFRLRIDSADPLSSGDFQSSGSAQVRMTEGHPWLHVEPIWSDHLALA